MYHLTRQRSSIRDSFTKATEKVREELEKKEQANQETLKKLWRRAEDRFLNLSKIDEESMQNLLQLDTTQEDMDEEINTVQDYRDVWNDINCSMDNIMQPEVDAISCSSTRNRADGKSRYNLPKLKLVEFSGNPKEWLTFWSRFKGIHEDEYLAPEEKFQYLLQATVKDSDAHRVVSSFPPTAANYQKAITHLKSRFGKDKVLVEVYVRDLLELVLSNVNGKQEVPLSKLYDQVETKLRALESLGVTTDKYAAMLYPLVESSLSEEVLRTWERMRNQRTEGSEENEDQLQQLMNFLRKEVESEIRLKMAKRSNTYDDEDMFSPPRKQPKIIFEPITATDLLNKERYIKCIFCGGNHVSQDCVVAKKLTMEIKLEKIREAGKCFKCLKGNHISRSCQAAILCKGCKKPHYQILCRQFQNVKKPFREINAISTYLGGVVILQTLLLKVEMDGITLILRVLIDTGSERSYITKNIVKKLGCKPVGIVGVNHCLFGGIITEETKHGVYSIEVTSVENSSKMLLELLDVEKICGYVSSIPNGTWVTELQEQGIILSDGKQEQDEINILIGADIASQIYTGRIHPTEKGPVAFETKLGWTLMGKIRKTLPTSINTLFTHTLHISNAKIEDLWRLDLIGINDPVESKNREEMTRSALANFEKNVCRLEDGRYEVQLPWIEGHATVGVNKEMANKRLQTTLGKLQRMNKIDDYQKIFDEWLEMGVIEEISNSEKGVEEGVSYLPHHPVFNPKSSTTPIRPVFDASAKSKGYPSLNNCLEKGPNMIELIPDILIRFRMKKYCVLSDVKKAFLQISVAAKDRNYLRFLWCRNGTYQIFRHCRVVFGLKSSPFLLAATLNHHLNHSDVKFKKTAELLKSSTYVDNVVVSVDEKDELKQFILESKDLCSKAKLELRNWVWNTVDVCAEDVSGVGSPECGLDTVGIPSQETLRIVSVLGLLWDVEEDSVSLDLRKLLMHSNDIVSKRNILAMTHRIFDPIGFASPVTIIPKMMLQELFKKKFKWDELVPADIAKRFQRWLKDVEILQVMKIPRWVMSTKVNNKSIHVFTDASKGAYAAVAFIRMENKASVDVQLLMAKSRVSTVKPITIPRLELIACECGAKLLNYLKKTIDMVDIKVFLWSDSSNALSWIKEKENWQMFVHNRVKSIKELTNTDDWRHIPGDMNPADLPSRGCTSKQLLMNRWWEGPEWLKRSEEFWPKSEINCNEEVVMAEKRKIVISHTTQVLESSRYFQYFSGFRKVIRTIAWMRRWKNYKRNQKSGTNIELSLEEEKEAEVCLWKLIQSEAFDSKMGILCQYNAVKDTQGLLRVKTRLTMRPDSEDFKCPILLPKNHIATNCLIRKEHLEANHSGSQVLRCSLRERFWVINSRVAVRKIVNSCGRCRRFGAKKFTAPEPPLPLNRVRDSTVFEVVGIDLGGPLYLKDNEKIWFAVFTCAVYRAVHLELVSSLSTEGFVQALRRFIARRGRPEAIYTDNGTNFTGTENLMEELDWDEISKTSIARRIKWIFNPPSAPWWGGWWEIIVGMVKRLLRCNLGRQTLKYEEMETILCDCEQVINSRPLTYLSEDPNELVALTPMMFLIEARSSDVMDLDNIEYIAFGERYKHRQQIRQELRDRFRKEYLSQLVYRNIRQSGYNKIKIGDIVLVELDNKKRIDWPVAEVIELFPSSDGVVRSVRLRMKKKEFTRAIQKLYLLEASIDDLGSVPSNISTRKEDLLDEGQDGKGQNKEIIQVKNKKTIEEPVKMSRHGRIIKKPERFSS